MTISARVLPVPHRIHQTGKTQRLDRHDRRDQLSRAFPRKLGITRGCLGAPLASVRLHTAMPENQATIFLPSSLEEVVEQVTALPLNAFDILRGDVRSTRGFDADKIRCEALAEKLPLSAENIAIILSALSFLYTRVNSVGRDIDVKQAVDQLLRELYSDKLTGKKSDDASYRLAQLVSRSTEIEQSRKLRRLRTGFIKNATAFSSFVDARPNYDDNNQSIRGFIAMLQFRISTDSDVEAEKEFVFQLSEDGLTALKAAVEAAESKLETLKRGDALVAPLHQSKND